MRRTTSALKMLTFISLAMISLSIPTKAATAVSLPSRNQIVEKIDSETPILGGSYVLVTYQDSTLNPGGEVVYTTTREAVLPVESGKGLETTSVQVQTISGQLATVLIPSYTLDDELKKMTQASNIVRILTVDGAPVDSAYKGFHFNLEGNLFDAPWNQEDSDLIAKIADTSQKSFHDVKPGRWSEGAIYLLVNDGIVHGIGDGQFAPSTPVTRAAFLTMLSGTAQAAGFGLSQEANVPSDTPSWATDYVGKVKGYLDSVEPNAFEMIFGSQTCLSPNKPMTRAEAAQIMAFFVNGESDGTWSFGDWDGGSERGRVSRLVEVGGISGTGDGKFGPSDTLTREQMASMCARLLYVN